MRKAKIPIAAVATSGTNTTIQRYSASVVANGTCKSWSTTTTSAAVSGIATHQGTMAVSGRNVLTAMASMVAQNTASTGEKPSSMKAMIEISEPKWNQ